MIGMSFTACTAVKSLSADYLTLSLERAKSKEERKKILEINKNQITSDFVISLIEKAGTCSGSEKEKLLAFEPGNIETGGYYPLPGAVKEVSSISKYFLTKEIYTGKNMKTDILYKDGKKSDVLHFATHGFLESDSPLFSSLLFSDRSLPVYEIFDLDLRAYLVTLSACKTGLGEEANGDEFVGLSRAFIYAGTPSICSSIWDVSDVSTCELMDRFYFHLKDKNKSEALRLAQLDTMKKYPHPFFWAPFILTGDWR
jgi:CHAT domain-containing protein